MKDYLAYEFDEGSKELISIQDELPYWSAPFGIELLKSIKPGRGIKALDIGSGFGFPMIEIANRLGNSGRIYGIDPWKPAVERIKYKIEKLGITNAEIINGYAEELPFEEGFFNLIVSNNGINNVLDMAKVFGECRRVSAKGAQFVFTLNLQDTMIEFYEVLRKVLEEMGLNKEVEKMKEHIYKKRRPVDEIEEALISAEFKQVKIRMSSFEYRFADAGALFNYPMIKWWFLPAWKELIPGEYLEPVFEKLEEGLNRTALKQGEIKLTIPFATFEAVK